ncbi:Amino acid/polyamine transporter I [Penicillium robsamsonii]|uniref:Amino acid/polyamine transporter I n=1 Tax=Penicillium robsamsonii TaxID=1792511 RepID=UPI00254929CE|nr:Amino acid/polyamine transporter I [Penicillium robsamsonii]KAJ5835265.1 Amino acid/polyamine transporter I [Penicillium robsamsonii]
MMNSQPADPEAVAPVAAHMRADVGDVQLLARMGYKQELRRQYSTPQVFAIAFSIMGLVPSIASTLSFSLPVGPVGMVWGWFTASIFIFLVGLAMADLASAMPTAGGLYWWTHYFAGPKWKSPLSFLIGYSNTLGLIGGMCSVDYTLALMILSCVSISRGDGWSASRGVIYAVYVGLILFHGLCGSLSGRLMPKIQTFCIYINIALVVATVIALPVGKVTRGGSLNPGHYVYGHIDNETTWPTGWAFMMAWLAPIWSIGSFDSCVHMSEEAMHASKAVPLGIVWSAGSAFVLGFLVLSVIAATMNPDVSATISTKFGQPMAQIYYDALGRDGALAFMAVLCVVQFLIGLSLIVAASRQAWAFSRDGALPFSRFFRQVSKRIQYQPVRMIWGLVFVSILLGLLSLINSAAANALFSLFVASNYLSWGTPIFCRLVWGEDRFTPGEFYTGHFSRLIAWVAIVYLLFGVILSMFPTEGHSPTSSNMNYTIVINAFVWFGCMAYYFLYARRWYTGPQMTVDESNSTASDNIVVAAVPRVLPIDEPGSFGRKKE